MISVFAERLLFLLRSEGVTQKELAKRTGLTEVSISRYVRGDRMPRVDDAAKIAMNLHTTVEYMLGLEYEEDPMLTLYMVQRAIARNASKWTKRHKAHLVNDIFEVDLKLEV